MKYVKSKEVSPFLRLERLMEQVSEREAIEAENLSIPTFRSILEVTEGERFDNITRGDMEADGKAEVALSREELELLIGIVQEAKGISTNNNKLNVAIYSSNETWIKDVQKLQEQLQSAYRRNFNGRS